MAVLNDDQVNIRIATNADTKGIAETEASFGKLTGAVAAGQAVYAIAAAAVQKVGSEVSSVVTTTEDWTRSTVKLQREMGVSAETASSLLAVTNRFGVDGDAASKAFGILAKQVTAASEGSKGAIDTFSHFGLSVTDASGKTKDFNTLFGEIADKFKDAPAGFDKTAESMKLFGKSGKDMLPILNLGSKGIAELEANAKKMGLVLTQNNVNSVRKMIMAQKDWEESTQGLKIQLGTAILPVLTKLVEAIVNNIIPAIRNFGHEMMPVIDHVIALTHQVADALRPSFDALMNQVKTMMPTLKTLWNDVLKPLAIVIGVALVGAAYILINVLRIVIVVIKDLVQWGKDVGQWLVKAWHDIVGAWQAAGDFFRHIWDTMRNDAKRLVDDIVNFFKELPDRALHAVGNIGSRIGSDIKNALHSIHIPGFATGVTNFQGGLAVVGERGPELVNLPAGSDVIPAGKTAQVLNSSTKSITIQNVNLNTAEAAKEFFRQIDRDQLLVGRGLSPVRGS